MPKMPKVMELSATASNFQITIPRIAGSNFKQYPNLKYQSKTMQRHNSSIGYYFVQALFQNIHKKLSPVTHVLML